MSDVESTAQADIDQTAAELGDLPAELIAAISMEMPFGRFKGRRLIDLPEPYVVWFKREGFPTGKLGERLGLIYEIKANGLEKLLRPLIRAADDQADESREIGSPD